MPGFIGLPEILLLGLVALILFGPKRLPEMGRRLGKGLREFKESVTGDDKAPARHRLTSSPPTCRRTTARETETQKASVATACLPRRLGHGQEAALVDHLEELRSRIFVAGGAVLVGTIVAYVFHARILRVLIDTLPAGHRKLITFGVAEPFTTSLKVSLVAGFMLALPIVLWQLWAFFAPALDPKTQRGHRRLRRLRGGADGRRRRSSATRRAARGASFLTNFDNVSLRHPAARRGLHLVRGARARRMRRGLRTADRRARAGPGPRALRPRSCGATGASAT